MHAAQNGHEQCVRVMIEAGVSLESKTLKGFTALMLAAQNGHEHVARNLLMANADPNKAANNGFTALMLSCQNSHLEVSSRTLTPVPAFPLANPEARTQC